MIENYSVSCCDAPHIKRRKLPLSYTLRVVSNRNKTMYPMYMLRLPGICLQKSPEFELVLLFLAYLCQLY